VPAAAVIPAPIAYIHVVAVKKLVVEHKARRCGALRRYCAAIAPRMRGAVLRCCEPAGYCEEIRVFKAGVCLNTAAWNNE
jgi:hypothetical protein